MVLLKISKLLKLMAIYFMTLIAKPIAYTGFSDQ